MYFYNDSNSVELTRQKLYEQVWSMPTVQLAKTYGISDVAISKICKEHKIPKPPPGYWVRKQYGYKVSQKPLPTVNDPRLETVHMPVHITAADQHTPSSDAVQKIVFEKKEENQIVVPEHLISPHSLVEKTAHSIGSAKIDEKGLAHPRAKGCLDVSVAKTNIDRAMRILDALLKALEARGYRINVVEKENRSETHVAVLDEKIVFRLEEEVEGKEHPLTREQKEHLAKWGYFYGRKIDYFPTGRLRLRISDAGYPGHRKSWGDTETRRLEDCLNKFIAGLVNAAEGSKRVREEDEKREREWQERERIWREEEERKTREENRIKELDSLVSAWTKCDRIRKFIRAVETNAEGTNIPVTAGSNLDLWLSWARKRADSIDPLLNWTLAFKQ